jgi:hypothetical protein
MIGKMREIMLKRSYRHDFRTAEEGQAGAPSVSPSGEGPDAVSSQPRTSRQSWHPVLATIMSWFSLH